MSLCYIFEKSLLLKGLISVQSSYSAFMRFSIFICQPISVGNTKYEIIGPNHMQIMFGIQNRLL